MGLITARNMPAWELALRPRPPEPAASPPAAPPAPPEPAPAPPVLEPDEPDDPTDSPRLAELKRWDRQRQRAWEQHQRIRKDTARRSQAAIRAALGLDPEEPDAA